MFPSLKSFIFHVLILLGHNPFLPACNKVPLARFLKQRKSRLWYFPTATTCICCVLQILILILKLYLFSAEDSLDLDSRMMLRFCKTQRSLLALYDTVSQLNKAEVEPSKLSDFEVKCRLFFCYLWIYCAFCFCQ